jgi:type IV pilus assembly protein PilC
MADFVIKVADERGHVREQVEAARSEAEVRDRLSQQGLYVYWVKPRGMLSGGSGRKNIKLSQFVIFNAQFVTLIHAGLPILHALDLLARRQRDKFFASVLQNVRDRVKGGELLSTAFEAQGIFPKMYTTTVMAGEKSGNLEEVLSRYVGYQRMTMTFKKKLISSLIYPCLLVVGITVMLAFLVTFVIPRFAELYNQLEVELPAMTQFMLAVGTHAQKIAPIALVSVVAIGFIFWRWASTESGSEYIDRGRISVPLLGNIWLKYQVAVFARIMSTLLGGGLPLVPALETASKSIQSKIVGNGVRWATERVREGRSLSKSIEESKAFPEMSVEMIEVGESTGALPAMLTSVAEFYEEDVETALSAAMQLIEPIILVVMGIVVAFVLISLYLPIFKLGAGGALR